MPSTPDKDGTRAGRAVGALLVLPALCCGLLLLIAGGRGRRRGALAQRPPDSIIPVRRSRMLRR